MTEIKPYIPQDAIKLVKDESKFEQAKFNQASPSYSLFIDGKLVACGGVRLGVGDAWFIMSDDDRQKMKTPQFNSEQREIMRFCRNLADSIPREHGLWKLYADNEISQKFLEVLGFQEQTVFVR